jgi:hypothetical protein
LEEGHRSSEIAVSLPKDLEPTRSHFEQGDAMNLRADLGPFDRVLAANLVCRLPEPQKFLARLPEDTLGWLKKILEKDFALTTEANEPFLIRETARKFQWTVALVTKWQRR